MPSVSCTFSNRLADGLAGLAPTSCAICGTFGHAEELYSANFSADAFSSAVFSARRLPDRLHYRLVRCLHCGLVRSDPVAQSELLGSLYEHSAVTYNEEIPYLRRTYGRYLDKALHFVSKNDTLLEIGCGDGFFLAEAIARGMSDVWGVEPSTQAVASASEHLRKRLVRDVMRPGLFSPEQFGLICLFQVFDHLPDPAGLVAECHRLLRPGGVVLALNHDVAAWSARMLGERSPIIDIEHTYLYSRETMSRIFQQAGYEIVEAGSAWNLYPLRYLLRLTPLPIALKRAATVIASATGLGKLSCWVPLGNLFQIARKPAP